MEVNMSTAVVYRKGGDYLLVLRYPPSPGEQRHEVRAIEVTGTDGAGVSRYTRQFTPDSEQAGALLRAASDDATARGYSMICAQDGGTSPDSAGYTREQVSEAVNAGADLVRDDLDLGDCDTDLINLLVNAALTLLDEPGLSLDDVIRRCYETEPAEVRGWWSGWS
jgi:hypothetical protein